MLAERGEDLVFLERELLDDDRVGDGDFEATAFEAAWERVRCEGFTRGGAPGCGEICVGLDAAVAACGDQLCQDILDGFGSAGVVPALFALAAKLEIGGGLVIGVDVR